VRREIRDRRDNGFRGAQKPGHVVVKGTRLAERRLNSWLSGRSAARRYHPASNLGGSHAYDALQTVYVLCVIALIGSTGWAAGGIKSGRQPSAAGVGIALLAALQR